MKNATRSARGIVFLPFFVLLVGALASAQNPELQQKVAEMKQAAAKNKQALAQYTWVEEVTISLKGEPKKQEQYQVRLGPDGKPQKTAIETGAPPAEQSSGRQGRLKKHVVENKKKEFKEYGADIKNLVQQYVPPDKAMIEEAYQQNNIMMGPQAGSPEQYRLVISNYIKKGDSMTLIIDKTQKDLVSVSIASYLDDPKDAVNVVVQFSGIPGGPNHVASEMIEGVRKQLKINVRNVNYQKL